MSDGDGRKARALRVGLIYDGAVVDERVVEAPRPVSVGSEPGATLAIDGASVPERFGLFDWEDGEYVLCAKPGMRGTVRVDGAVEPLGRLVARAEADTAGRARIAAGEITEGRVEFGDAVVVFQRVEPRSGAQPPSMPRALKRGLFGAVDRRLAGAVAAVALAQIGFVAWTQLQSWPSAAPDPMNSELISVEDDWSDPPTEVATSEKEPRPTEPAVADEEQERAEESTETSDASPEPREDRAESSDSEGESSTSERNVSEEAAAEGTVLEALGSEGGEEMLGDMATASGDEFDEAIAEGRQRDSESSEGMLETGGRSSSDGSGEAVGSGDLEPSGGAREAAAVETGGRDEVGVRCTDCGEQNDRPDSEGPTVDVGSVIERYRGRIQACYERRIKREKVAGKVVVAFRVAPDGTATGIRAPRNTVGGGVAGCLKRVFGEMQFPEPEEQTSEYRKTFVFQPSE